jgi:hypothetical protein
MHESLRAANEAMILCEHAWNNEKNGKTKTGAGDRTAGSGGSLISSGMEYLFHTQGIKYKYYIYIYIYC